MILINTNVVASRHIKRKEVLLPVAVRSSKTPELKSNFIRGNEGVTHSTQSEFSGRNGFLRGIFCLEYPSRRSEKVNCHFANCRFSFRKLQIFISFRFAPFRFANYSKPPGTQLCIGQIVASTSPPRANPGHLTSLPSRGEGNLIIRVFQGVGNLIPMREGWGI